MSISKLPCAARVIEIVEDNYRTKTFVFDLQLAATPGQFVMAWLPRFDEKPFSLVNCNPVTLMITAVGPFTRCVHELVVGDQLWLRGPFGHGFEGVAESRRPALLGGGYGVAPLLWVARERAAHHAPCEIVIGARSAADLLYVERFQALAARHPELTVHVTTEDGSAGQPGRVTDCLEPLAAAGVVDSLLACGPHGMLAALERLASRFCLPAQLSWEAYMRCGMGICGACEHRGRVLCMEGPVLAVSAA